MAGVTSSFPTAIIVDSREVDALMACAAESIGVRSIQYWLREHIDPHMRKSFAKNFTEEKAPQGNEWAALAPDTVTDREKMGIRGEGPKLRRKSYHLYDLVTKTKGESTLGGMGGGYGMTWGANITSVMYRANQVGSFKSGKGHNILPPRRMIGFRREDRPFIIKDLENWVNSRIRTRKVYAG